MKDRTNLLQYQVAYDWLARCCRDHGAPDIVAAGDFAPPARAAGAGGLLDAAFGAIADVAAGGQEKEMSKEYIERGHTYI